MLYNTLLRCLIIGGEKANKQDIELWMTLLPTCRVIHHYGPTEATVGCISLTLSTVDELNKFDNLPLGCVATNTQAYVLDENKSLLPMGIVGELHIGGAGVGVGYFNQPELTDERFISNPFVTEEDRLKRYTRLYKTGDLVKRLPDGNLEYIGRNDFQVKLRGFRIEPSEIEHALNSLEGISHSVVIQKYHGLSETKYEDKYLLAYYTTEDNVEQFDLSQRLATILPHYMVPALFMYLEYFPLTVSGKIDRQALPEAEFKKSKHFVPPEHQDEMLLADIWRSVLNQNEVGLHDNFFDLGGNSILLMQVYNRLPDKIKEKLKLVDLFTYPNIASLQNYISSVEDCEVIDVSEKENAFSAFTQLDLDNTSSPVYSDISHDNQAIAVVGMAGRFVDADELNIFWQNLMAGKESVTAYTNEELIEAGITPQLLNDVNYVKKQSRLDNIAYFDADFFGISSKNAEMMDPQHRIFMECAWHALEDAAYNPWEYQGDIGLYAGCGQNNYFQQLVEANEWSDVDRFSAMLENKPSFLTTKIAYALHLTGPAMTIETACSSSLVAVHQACLALLQGDCDMALAGGVSIEWINKQGYMHEPGFILSKDGHCRPFDMDASGTFPGQGVGIVVLKPLHKALDDHDNIYAVIKATSINNDGHQKVGFTAPSVEKQAAVIRKAHKKAGININELGYIEAHGTATSLGDPIEVEALSKAFEGLSDKKQFCALGSIKSNLGHLGDAAGIAGFIKTTLCIYHRMLVPTLHYQSNNKQIDFQSSPFFVNTETTSWLSHHLRKAGVSSFGMGGTNAHVILEEAPQQNKTISVDEDWHLFIISGNSKTALTNRVNNLSKWLISNLNVSMASLAYTLQVVQNGFKYNKVFVSKSAANLQHSLDHQEAPIIQRGQPRAIIFILSAQRTKNCNMAARELYQSLPDYKKIVDVCLLKLQACLLCDIGIDTLLKESNDPVIIGASIFIIEYALAKFLINIGVIPTGIIGHGYGEYVAACLANVISIEDALWIICGHKKKINFDENTRLLHLNLPSIPLISSVTGMFLADEVTSPAFWLSCRKRNNMTNKERQVLVNKQPVDTIFVDMNPRQNKAKNDKKLSYFNVRQTTSSVIAEIAYLFKTIGELDATGVKVDWRQFYHAHDKSRVRLPAYPFDKNTYWISTKKTGSLNIDKKPIDIERKLFLTDFRVQMISIWEKIFGFHISDENQDFFDMGGDSLMVIQLAAEIKKEFGFFVDLATLNTISIHSLIKALSDYQGVLKHDSVVVMQQGSSCGQSPLILVHPIGGDIYFYRDLVRSLPSEQTVIAIRSPLLKGNHIAFKNIENMATYYIKLLEEAHIKPPFILGGASFGGIVAFDMAKQYHSLYAYAPSVVMMDSPCYGYLPARKTKTQILEYMVTEMLGDIKISIAELNHHVELESKIMFIIERLKASHWGEGLSEQFVRVFLDVWQDHALCMEIYQPNAYDGDVIFFSPKEYSATIPAQQEQYWRSLVHGIFNTFVVPGNHLTMNYAPNVECIAEILIALDVFKTKSEVSFSS